MEETYKVAIKVVSLKGTCVRGHKVGDEWIVDESTPGGICMAAFGSLYANLYLLRFGGVFPWGSDPDTIECACPDPVNAAVFEVKRLRKETIES